MKLIQGATVYTVNERNEIIENCDILIAGGKIAAIGTGLSVTEATEVIDTHGYVLTPGLIDAHTHVGLWGETINGMNAGNESSTPFSPLMSAVDGIGPHHESFAVARSGGITAVQTGPGSGNVIGGVWSTVKTAGHTIEEIMLRKRSGLKGALGENPKQRHGQGMKQAPYTRMSIANMIREAFQQAQAAMREGRADLESLYKSGEEHLIPFIEVLNDEMPLRLHAHRADDIVTAIRLAKEFNVDLSIEHCTDGHKIVPYIKESGYKVTVGPFMGGSKKQETRERHLQTPKMMSEAGILMAINTDHPVNPVQYLSLAAADAVKHGLDEIEALRAITINPAMICRVDDRVGSIEVGKDADFVLWTHHPFRTKSRILYTYINGEIVYQNDRAIAALPIDQEELFV